MMLSNKNIRTYLAAVVVAVVAVIGVFNLPSALAYTYPSDYQQRVEAYNQHEKPIVDAFRQMYNGSPAHRIVGRAIWYMEYGYTVYGHTSYATTGYIDCSQFVAGVYGDFGYNLTGASRKYDTVGRRVYGVYAKKVTGSSRYTLVGTDKLKPGDIFTFWAKDSSGKLYISHVALYMGKINGKPCIINTVKGRPTALGIINDFSYWYGEHLYQVRRVLPDDADLATSGLKLTDKGPVIPKVYQMPHPKVVLPKYLAKGF